MPRCRRFPYVRAAKQIAEQENAPVLDLFEYSRSLFEMLGEEDSKSLQSIKDKNGVTIGEKRHQRPAKWVEGYDENTGENTRYGITDKKRMNKVKEKLVLQQMVNVPGITVINGNMDIQVNYENKNGGNSIYCYSICTDDEMQQLLKE